MNANMTRNSIVRLAIFLLIFFCVVLGVRRLALGGNSVIKLSSAPALSGQIAQTLGPDTNGSFPTDGKDYTLNTRYFDGGWAVVKIRSNSNNFQSGFVVMKQKDGIYQVAIGPGTSMSSAQLVGVPGPVAAYLIGNVAISNPLPGQK